MAVASASRGAPSDAATTPTVSDVRQVTVTLRYFAAARAATGVDEEAITLDADATIDQALDAASRAHGDAFVAVLQRCSFLHNATAVHDTGDRLSDGDLLDVLPPFAGG